MIYFSQQIAQMKQIGTRYACAAVRMANASEALRYLLNQLNQLTKKTKISVLITSFPKILLITVQIAIPIATLLQILAKLQYF